MLAKDTKVAEDSRDKHFTVLGKDEEEKATSCLKPKQRRANYRHRELLTQTS